LDKTLYFFSAGRYEFKNKGVDMGRYEFKNKGVDMLIESLARLNYCMQVYCPLLHSKYREIIQ